LLSILSTDVLCCCHYAVTSCNFSQKSTVPLVDRVIFMLVCHTKCFSLLLQH